MTRWNPSMTSDEYDERWRRMAEAGENPHGEADFIGRFAPATVLDGGCGTGRVAIELACRGVDVVGVDLDETMLDAARAKAPELAWVQADLATLDLGRRFDVVALPGNVMIFVAEDDRPVAVARCAAHLGPDGLLIAGFQLARGMRLPAYDAMTAAAGLTLIERFATWDGEPYAGGDYVVSVHAAVSVHGAASVHRD